MNKPNGNNQIILLFEPNSNMIINIVNKATGEIYLPDKIELAKSNIYDWAKSIKPAPDEFGELSSLLMALKRHTPDNEINYKFSNNGNFLTEYLLGTQKSKDIKINKHFWVSYTQFGKYHAINVILTIKSISAVVVANNSITFDEHFKSSYRKVGETFEHIRHELINPLNAIKISGDQIRNHIRRTNGQISPDDIDKFNNIILSQVDNSLDIINTFTKLHDQPTEELSTPLLSLEKIPITVFRKYIESQIEKINQTYFMLAPVHIEWESAHEDQLEYVLTHYVCISMNYMKIILDNIFRNIYGHLSAENQPESRKYNNKFIIAVSESKIELKIYNEIHGSVDDNSQHNTQYNWSCRSNKLAQRVINKYDLFIGELPTKSNKLQHDKTNNLDKTREYKPNKGIGLTLINNLCRKMDVQWQLIDNETDICFTLSIPVLTDTRQLPIFYEPIIHQISQELVLC